MTDFSSQFKVVYDDEDEDPAFEGDIVDLWLLLMLWYLVPDKDNGFDIRIDQETYELKNLDLDISVREPIYNELCDRIEHLPVNSSLEMFEIGTDGQEDPDPIIIHRLS